MTFYGTQKPTLPQLFQEELTQLLLLNLQASDWVHCDEETGAYYQLSLFSYKFVIFFLPIFKVVNFAQKKITRFSKNSIKFIIPFY